jgi:hypothetical protein
MRPLCAYAMYSSAIGVPRSSAVADETWGTRRRACGRAHRVRERVLATLLGFADRDLGGHPV